MSVRAESLTVILNEMGVREEDDSGLARALPFVYDELKGLADAFLRGERRDHTLQATALVHEAYLRLANSAVTTWQDRGHFFRLAAKTMRHILVDHARARAADKRGGGAAAVMLSETALLTDGHTLQLLEIDDALKALFALSPERAQVVELRFYGGCTIDETAEALGVSTATVERHWRFARAWLQAQLSEQDRT